MDQRRKPFLVQWQVIVACLVWVLASSASALDVGGGGEVVEVSLPDVTEELPEPQGVLEGDCLNISLKNNDWSWDDKDGQMGEGETMLLIKKLLKRLNNETERIHMQNPNLNLTHFVRLVASRSSLQLLKIKSFARVFGHVNALYGYTCRNGKQLLRHALQRNITDEDMVELDDGITAEIDTAVDGAMDDDTLGAGSPGKTNNSSAARKENRAAVRMFIRRAVLALFLSPRRVRGLDVPRLSEYISNLANIGTLGDLMPSQLEDATDEDDGSKGDAGNTEVATEGDGAKDEEDEFLVAFREVFEFDSWFDGYDHERDLIDDDEMRMRFSFEGYLFKLMSGHVNKSASCAHDVKRFIKKHVNHTRNGMSNMTEEEEGDQELWNRFQSVMGQLNATRRRNFTGGFPGGNGWRPAPTGNPLDGTEDLVGMARNLTRRLAKGRWIGKGGIEGSFYVVLMKMTAMIDSWGRAGFLSNGTYFDAKCSMGQSRNESATTSCQICPTDAAFTNLRMLISELDDVIKNVYDGIKEGLDRMTGGPVKEQLQVYRFPRLDLAESIFTLSDEDECTPFTLTFSIPPPREGDNPSGTDDGDETGTDGEVISYEDFSTLREEQFPLPDLPFALSRQDANQLQGKTKRLMTDEVAFKSDKQLVVEGKFCDMGSRLLELCLTLDGSTRIRTNDAPEGKCHNITLYSGAPVLTSARLSDTADAIVIFFDKDVNAKNLRECSAIFDNATLNLFGEEAQCDWRQGKELVVLLSKSSTIDTGSQITLKEDSIKAFKQRFSHTATGSLGVNAPNNPVTPTARIDGDPKVPSCGSVKLSGRRSKGGGSRGLTYTWSLQNPAEGVDEKINRILKKANDGNNADLVIPGNLLLEETPYEWRLNVRNIQELEHSTTFTLEKATGQEPRFEIRTTGIPEVKPVKVTSAVSLFGDISFNRGPGCPKLSASDVQFQWSISGAQFEEGAITMNKRVLKFPPKTLPGNRDITAALTVTYGAENPANLSKSVTFSTAYEPLVARIKGGESLTAGVGSDNFTLDCSQSQDPNYEGDGPDEGLSFEWRCWQKTDRTDCSYDDPEGGATITLPTFDQGSAKDILTVDPSKMTAGKVYSFSCYVDKDNFDQVHDSVTIMVTENNPPRISLRLLKSKDGAYRPDSDVAIQSTVSGDDISELKWDDVGGGLDGFDEEAFTNIKDTTKDEEETTLTTSDVSDSDKPYTITIRQKDGNFYSLLRIKKDRLRAGSRYEMQVSALSGEEVGTSTIEFRILPKVSGCQFEFGGNDSYVDTATGVSYSVQACAAEEDKTLTYQAFAMFTLDDQRSSLRLRGQTSEYPDILVNHDVYDKVKRKIEDNEDVPFQVGVRVCYQDTKICADFKKDVTYVHVPLTAEEVDAKKEEINDLKKEGRPVEGLKTANGAQKAVASQNTEGERKRRATVGFDQELLNLQMELLILATGDPSNYDGYPGDVQSMVDAAVEVPINAYQPEEMREILGADKDVLKSVKDLDERLPQETLDGIRQHLEDAKMAFGDGKFFTENREILGLLSKCLSKNSVTGERVTSHGDGILITIEATLNIDPILIPKGDGDITFNGGGDVRNRYGASWEGCGCDECVGVLVEFFIYRGQDYVAGESHGSDVVSLQFINPCTGDPMEVQNLEEPASMSIPFSSPWSTNDEAVCSYYDEDMMAWSQAGVETLVDGMDVVCRTNHTTEYVIDFVMVGGAVAEPTATTAEGGEMITQDDDDDDDDDIDIPGLNGLLGLGIGVIVGIVLASLVVLAIIIVLIALVIKNLNKPKMIVEPIVKA